MKEGVNKATPKADGIWETGSAASLDETLTSRCTLGTASSNAREVVGDNQKRARWSLAQEYYALIKIIPNIPHR